MRLPLVSERESSPGPSDFSKLRTRESYKCRAGLHVVVTRAGPCLAALARSSPSGMRVEVQVADAVVVASLTAPGTYPQATAAGSTSRSGTAKILGPPGEALVMKASHPGEDEPGDQLPVRQLSSYRRLGEDAPPRWKSRLWRRKIPSSEHDRAIRCDKFHQKWASHASGQHRRASPVPNYR
jgi:hypothetical protein